MAASNTRATHTKHRVETIDHLRGVLAVGVMIYHLHSWNGSDIPVFAHALLVKVGVYAVPMFYVISGISLGYVYSGSDLDGPRTLAFFIKRYFRLVPLYAFTFVTAAALRFAATGQLPSLAGAALNLSMVFGVLRPQAYGVTGGWSIGNEIAFYVAFPALMWLARRSQTALVACLAVACGALIYFGFYTISPTEKLAVQWVSYINPFNQLFFFVAGVTVAVLMLERNVVPSRHAPLILMAAAVSFALLPWGPSETIVTGLNRLLYSALSVALCTAVCFSPLPRSHTTRSVLGFLGHTSYSIYLLHPIVYRVASAAASIMAVRLHPAVLSAAVVFGTLISAHASHRHLETRFIDMGRLVAHRVSRSIDTRMNRSATSR